jgi:hypothetical protein
MTLSFKSRYFAAPRAICSARRDTTARSGRCWSWNQLSHPYQVVSRCREGENPSHLEESAQRSSDPVRSNCRTRGQSRCSSAPPSNGDTWRAGSGSAGESISPADQGSSSHQSINMYRYPHTDIKPQALSTRVTAVTPVLTNTPSGRVRLDCSRWVSHPSAIDMHLSNATYFYPNSHAYRNGHTLFPELGYKPGHFARP